MTQNDMFCLDLGLLVFAFGFSASYHPVLAVLCAGASFLLILKRTGCREDGSGKMIVLFSLSLVILWISGTLAESPETAFLALCSSVCASAWKDSRVTACRVMPPAGIMFALLGVFLADPVCLAYVFSLFMPFGMMYAMERKEERKTAVSA